MKYTKYEKARIVGSRALQIAMGAPLLVKVKDMEEHGFNPVNLAKLEFEEGAIPITVRRKSPDGKIEHVHSV